jgi:uncharacterized protein (TIRG00374 family)
VAITGENTEEVTELMFSTPKIVAKPVAGTENKFTVNIAADTPVGVYDARVMSRLGVSSARAFSVNKLPEVMRTKANTSLETAKALPVGTICNAAMTKRAVDFYSFAGVKGKRVAIECAAVGIDSRLTPVVILADAKGADLLVNRTGGVIDFTPPADGTYMIKVSDLTFQGGERHFYRLALQEVRGSGPAPREPQTQMVSAMSWPPEGLALRSNAGLARALPALQPVALSPQTRSLLKENRELLTTLRESILQNMPETNVEEIEIERVKPRTLVTIFAGTIAAYLLLTQLGQVNFAEVFRVADTKWLLTGLAFSTLTYVAATLALSGVVPERLSFWKTFQAQWAASFATLVAPPTLGSVAINVRYLSKQGMHSALAGASVAVAQVMSFFSHISLLFIAVIAAGTSSDFSFRPPRTAIIVFLVIALSASALFTIPNVRRWTTERIQPIFSQVLPRLSSLANQPTKLVTGVFGVLLLNLSYCACLVAAVRAFTNDSSVAAIALVYLAGSIVGQAAPTPGGLGAVEAALAAGLTAAGIDPGIAISATLVFRLMTFWIPTIPGWFAFQNLQRTGNL